MLVATPRTADSPSANNNRPFGFPDGNDLDFPVRVFVQIPVKPPLVQSADGPANVRRSESSFHGSPSFSRKSISVLATPLANKYGTPFPIVLNFADSDTPTGNSNSLGNDWMAKVSATESRRAR